MKKNSVKIVSLLLVAVMLMGALTACGGGSTAETDNNNSGDSNSTAAEVNTDNNDSDSSDATTAEVNTDNNDSDSSDATAAEVNTDNNGSAQTSESAGNSGFDEVDVSSVTLTDATGDNFTVGVADGWKLMTAKEIDSFMDGFDWVVKGDAYDAMGSYIQIGTTTGNINEWVDQLKEDIYVKYDKEYVINGITWYVADQMAGAEIDGKIVTVSPQNGVNLTDVDVQAMMGSIRWAK